MRRRFLYWLDGGCSEQILSQRGIYDRFALGAALGPWRASGYDAGPSGMAGCIVAGGKVPGEYKPERQAWIEAEGYWVSVEDADVPPGPQDLARWTQLDGPMLTLAGGQWRIPRVWSFNTTTGRPEANLPSAYAPVLQGPNRGRFERQVLPAYRPLVEIAERAWNVLLGAGRIPWEQAFPDAALLLAANYRIGPPEIGLLGLLDEAACSQVLQACVDAQAVQAQADEARTAGLVPGCPIEDADAMEGPSHG